MKKLKRPYRERNRIPTGARAEQGGDGVYRSTVPDELRGCLLQDYLERLWPGAQRRFLRRAVAEGGVRVNREPGQAHRRLRAGDLVEASVDDLEMPLHESAPESTPELQVLHEDSRVLVVDKPSGVHTVPDRAGKYQGVHGELQRLRPDDDLRIVHRLDVGTSGCLVLAKGLEVARSLSTAFKEGRVHKEYVALVDGVMSRERFEVKRALGPDRRRPGRVCVVQDGSKGSRTAHTIVAREEQFRRHALLRVQPQTGRSHQIRVHLSASGLPVVGDPDYGTARELMLSDIKVGFKLRRGVEERPLLSRMFLHAEVVDLPSADERVRVRAPLPPELEMVLNKLRRFSSAGGESCD